MQGRVATMSRATDTANLNQHAHFMERVTAIQKVNHATCCPLFTHFNSRSASGNATPRPASAGFTARPRDRSGVYGPDQRREGAPPWSRSNDGRWPPRALRCGPGLGVGPDRPVSQALFRCAGRVEPPQHRVRKLPGKYRHRRSAGPGHRRNHRGTRT